MQLEHVWLVFKLKPLLEMYPNQRHRPTLLIVDLMILGMSLIITYYDI